MPTTDTRDMLVFHRVFRREFPMAATLIRSVPAGDLRRARPVATHLSDLHLGLRHHHTGEDELLWPLLLARVDLDADKVLLMEAQHRRVDALLSRTSAALPRWEATADPVAGEELAALHEELWPVLLEHLVAEETEILPLVAEHITQSEWNRLREHFERETGRASLRPA